MLTATRRFTFDSSHVLPNHSGKCSRLHGHTYILEVTVGPLDGEETSKLWADQGFFIDFGLLKEKVKKVLESWDHRHLNTLDFYPTAERLILLLWAQLTHILTDVSPYATCKLITLRLHETPNNWVEYDGHDQNFSHVVTPPTKASPHDDTK